MNARDALLHLHRAVHPYLQLALFSPYTLQWDGNVTCLPQKTLPLCGPGNTNLIVPWTHPNPLTKRHLGRLIRFCRAHGCDQQRHTERHTVTSIAISRILCFALQCDLKTNRTLFTSFTRWHQYTVNYTNHLYSPDCKNQANDASFC